MPYQFFHIEAYSLSGSKPREIKTAGKKSKDKKVRMTPGRLSVGKVMAEAQREPGSHPHVPNPQPPELVWGDLQQVEAAVKTFAMSAIDSQGRKLRKDKLLLLGAVASYPVPVEDMDRNDPEFRAWLQSNLDYFKGLYEDQFVACCVHWDEEYPHLHAYIIPSDGQIRSVHRGIAASDIAASDKKKAYNAGMREWQDEYYLKVGMPHGLTRIGPRGRRLSRIEWNAEQQQAKSLKSVIDSADQVRKQVILDAQAATIKMQLAAKLNAEMLITDARRKSKMIEAEAARQATNEVEKAKKVAQEIQEKAESDRARLVGEAASILRRVKVFMQKIQKFTESFLGLLPPKVRESTDRALTALGSQSDALLGDIKIIEGGVDRSGSSSSFRR